MFAKVASLVVCGLAAACSGAGQDLPVTRSVALEVCPGGTVRNDAELARFAKCDGVSGDLRISGVTSLAPLSHVRAVSGNLAVTFTNKLTSLHGLEQLESVQTLALVDNLRLDDICQLSQLRSAENVAIVKMPALRSLTGLSGLGTLNRLTLQETGLYALSGMENLKHVQTLKLLQNRELINVGGLNGLAETEELVVESNPRVSAQFGFFDGLHRAPHVTFTGNNGITRKDIAVFESRQVHTSVASGSDV
jgi:hypothetical protein